VLLQENGEPIDVVVDRSFGDVNTLKTGDSVSITYSRALLLRADKASSNGMRERGDSGFATAQSVSSGAVMRNVAQVVTLGIVVAGTACRDLERSRQVCSKCHGVTGVSVSPTFPKLAGQQREYLVAQLTDLKTRARSDPHANTFVWGFTRLTDAQINEIAYYFSSKPMILGKPGDRTLMAKGRTTFVSGLPSKGVPACSACHGRNGEGMGLFPRLAGQHAEYVVTQLLVFQRTNDRPRGATMKTVSQNMSEQDMRAVATFLEAFPQKAGKVSGAQIDP
jgi:cytochrome c553